MVINHFSERTIESYLRGARKLSVYYNLVPGDINNEQILDFLVYLKEQKNHSRSSIRIYAAGIKYLYAHFYNRKDILEYIPYPKKARKLPVILSGKEVKKIFEVTTNIKHRVLLKLTYGSGLRRNEIRQLKVVDIDSKRMVLRIENSKGAKDRDTILPKSILPELRGYCRQHQPEQYLFFGRSKHKPISEEAIRWAFEKAIEKAGIKKKVSLHSLRHSFASHLLSTGHNLIIIQQLLGHEDIRTTMVYLQVNYQKTKPPVSPLDTLYP